MRFIKFPAKKIFTELNSRLFVLCFIRYTKSSAANSPAIQTKIKDIFFKLWDLINSGHPGFNYDLRNTHLRIKEYFIFNFKNFSNNLTG